MENKTISLALLNVFGKEVATPVWKNGFIELPYRLRLELETDLLTQANIEIDALDLNISIEVDAEAI